jgi:hypothetical protein
MGCGWRLEVDVGDCETKDKKPLLDLLSELDESGAVCDDYYGDDQFTLFFGANHSFSITAWIKAQWDILKDYPEVCFYLYCEEQDPDESATIGQGLLKIKEKKDVSLWKNKMKPICEVCKRELINGGCPKCH